jgi:hypothetical protein
MKNGFLFYQLNSCFPYDVYFLTPLPYLRSMNKTHKSKVDLILILPILIVFAITIVFSSNAEIAMMVILAATSVVLLLTFYSIRYKIDETLLKIYCFGIVFKKIPIADIKSIADTNSMLSSPAASRHRLDISAPRHGSVLVSPIDKDVFIKDLVSVNPDIVVNRKK